jgi:hypothetical protein
VKRPGRGHRYRALAYGYKILKSPVAASFKGPRRELIARQDITAQACESLPPEPAPDPARRASAPDRTSWRRPCPPGRGPDGA